MHDCSCDTALMLRHTNGEPFYPLPCQMDFTPQSGCKSSSGESGKASGGGYTANPKKKKEEEEEGRPHNPSESLEVSELLAMKRSINTDTNQFRTGSFCSLFSFMFIAGG